MSAAARSGRVGRGRSLGQGRRGRPGKPNLRRRIRKEQYFILANGRPVKNVKELAEVLEHLEDEVFRHHVRDDGHDFATWVRDVFKDVELAEKLARARDKHHLRLEIYKHVTKKYFREK